jgi:hypothetical protein
MLFRNEVCRRLALSIRSLPIGLVEMSVATRCIGSARLLLLAYAGTRSACRRAVTNFARAARAQRESSRTRYLGAVPLDPVPHASRRDDVECWTPTIGHATTCESPHASRVSRQRARRGNSGPCPYFTTGASTSCPRTPEHRMFSARRSRNTAVTGLLVSVDPDASGPLRHRW